MKESSPASTRPFVNSSYLIGLDAWITAILCSIRAEPDGRHDVSGLPTTAAKDSWVRVRSALAACDQAFLGSCQIEISPTPTMSAQLDLAIALAVVVAAGAVAPSASPGLGELLVLGELGLDGSVRAVRGVLAAALRAKEIGLRGVIVPAASAWEAVLVDGIAVYAVSHLSEAIAVVRGDGRAYQATRDTHPRPCPETATRAPDMADVRGQDAAIEAIARAVSRGDDVLLSGPPGTGKTLLARCVSSLLPEVGADELLAQTLAYSAVGLAWAPLGGSHRPFRAPHHTTSSAALVGGAGRTRRPGELGLAAHGVLYLDELTEFAEGTIEDLAREMARMDPPARPRIVASANPCPCGWRGSAGRTCSCSDLAIGRHEARLQRLTHALGIRTTIAIPVLSIDALRGGAPGPSSADLRARFADEGSR